MFSSTSDLDAAALRGPVEDALEQLNTLDLTEVPEAELTDHLPALYRLKAMIDAAIVDTVTVFDGRKQWSRDGAFSAAAWIAARTDTRRTTCSTTVTIARQARHMPAAMTQARNGHLSADQLRILATARGVSERTAKEYDDDETRLVKAVQGHHVEAAARLIRNWTAAADPDAEDNAHKDRDAKRKINLSTSLDGIGFLDGLLTAEANTVLRAQLEAITNDLHRWGLSTAADGTRLTAAQLRHDALIEMALRASASATTTNVRRDARQRADQAVAERQAAQAAAEAAASEAPGADAAGSDRPATADTSPPSRAARGPAPAETADHAATDGDGSDPDPAPGSTGTPDATVLHHLGLLPDGNNGTTPHHEPGDDDPRSTELEACSTLDAAQGLLLPPATGPPDTHQPQSTGPPDNKVAGGLGHPLFIALIDLDTLEAREPTDLLTHRAEAIGVGPLPHHTIRRYLCDAGISRVVTRGASLPLDVGATSRTATPAQWRALIAHTDHCEFPGCTAPWEWTEAHHLDGWTNTHRTNLDDLALGCHGHHHLLHHPGWTMTRNPDLTITVTRPDGTTLTDPHP